MWRVPRLRSESGLLRRRGAALLLTLLFEAVLILLLLFLVPPSPGGKKGGNITTFSVDAADDSADSSEATKADTKPRAEKASTRPPTPQPPVIPPPLPVPVPIAPRGPLPFIEMTRDEYRSAQIQNMTSRPSEPGSASASSGSNDSKKLGMGPGGQPLYAAEWYRRPRQVELDPYLPRRWAREGSGLIACRTAARNRVEDCQILGETPTGSGYGNAVLQAAWQFLVRPPRVGGKEMVGEWVSIRIDYNVIAK